MSRNLWGACALFECIGMYVCVCVCVFACVGVFVLCLYAGVFACMRLCCLRWCACVSVVCLSV